MGEELARQVAQQLTAVPDFLKTVKGNEGLENVTRDDLVLPRISICQAMTPQRKKSDPNYIEGLSDGELFNSVSKAIYGQRIELIPLIFSKSRIYFRKMEEGGGIICQSFNGVNGGQISPESCAACPNSKFGAKGEAPGCNEFKNFAVLTLPTYELAVLSFKSTALKAAKNWLTRMNMLNKPSYVRVYGVNIVETKNPKGTFYTPVINPSRWVSESEFKMAEEQATALRGRTIVADDTGLGHEEEEGPAF